MENASHKKLSYRRETARSALSAEILSTAARLYEKITLEKADNSWVTLKITQGRYVVGIAAIL